MVKLKKKKDSLIEVDHQVMISDCLQVLSSPVSNVQHNGRETFVRLINVVVYKHDPTCTEFIFRFVYPIISSLYIVMFIFSSFFSI